MELRVRDAVALVRRHPWAERAARAGYAASAVLHGLLAWVALDLAWGGYVGHADQTGALLVLGGTVVGAALLWAVAAAFVALTAWQLLDVVVSGSTSRRLRAAGRAAVYAVLAATAEGAAEGPDLDDPVEEDVTAALLAHPAGAVAVGLLAAVVVAVGAYHLVKGVRGAFVRDLRATPPDWVVHAGRAGYVAKGVALVVVGVLLGGAIPAPDVETPQGLDAALRALLEMPLGSFVVTLVAAGFAAYGVYAAARARFCWC